MTGKIKSAIGELERTRDTRVFFPKDISMKMAIRSLNAWEEVLNELEQRVKTFSKLCDKDPCMHYEDMEFAYMNCINIINQHLEIEE